MPAMGVLVIRDYAIAGAAVRGVRRKDGADPVKLDDPWHIGSDGKAMTVAMIARLADRGVLSWSTPLEKMLPEFATTMDPQYRAVTLIQLLSHQTGLPHDLLDEKAIAALFADRGPTPLTAQRARYLALALKDKPVGPVGSFNYSNTGLLTAALVAERATGESFETLMRREVFEPLGMAHVGFGLTHTGQPLGHLKDRPATSEDGNPDFFAPAGNMYMPLDDWARFCIDQLQGAKGNGRLLKPETYRLMQTAQSGGVMGLGWGVVPSVAGHQGPVLTHAGSDGTWYALVGLFPQTGAGVLITANAGEDMGAAAADKAVLLAVLDSLAPKVDTRAP